MRQAQHDSRGDSLARLGLERHVPGGCQLDLVVRVASSVIVVQDSLTRLEVLRQIVWL